MYWKIIFTFTFTWLIWEKKKYIHDKDIDSRHDKDIDREILEKGHVFFTKNFTFSWLGSRNVFLQNTTFYNYIN